MATSVQRRDDQCFDIHEDARTEETEMMMDDEQIEDVDPADLEEADRFAEDEQEEDEEEEEEESSDDENVERGVQEDMDKLQRDFPGFHDKYRLIKRIGEGLAHTSDFLSCPN